MSDEKINKHLFGPVDSKKVPDDTNEKQFTIPTGEYLDPQSDKTALPKKGDDNTGQPTQIKDPGTKTKE